MGVSKLGVNKPDTRWTCGDNKWQYYRSVVLIQQLRYEISGEFIKRGMQDVKKNMFYLHYVFFSCFKTFFLCFLVAITVDI